MDFRDTSRYWKFKHYYSVILKIKIEFGIVVQEPNVLAYMISVMNTCDLVGNDFQLRWRREAEGFIYFFGFWIIIIILVSCQHNTLWVVVSNLLSFCQITDFNSFI